MPTENLAAVYLLLDQSAPGLSSVKEVSLKTNTIAGPSESNRSARLSHLPHRSLAISALTGFLLYVAPLC